MKQNGREQFEAYYAKSGGCLLATVKENHWRTWLAAQVALLEAHGPECTQHWNDIAVMPGVNHD